jgi:hypothetical protein
MGHGLAQFRFVTAFDDEVIEILDEQFQKGVENRKAALEKAARIG